MKRYLLFAGDDYYPLGGWEDFQGDFDLCVNAKNFRKYYFAGTYQHLAGLAQYEIAFDWKHIVDSHSGCVILVYNIDKGWHEA